MTRRDARQQGQVVVFFAVLLPVLLVLGSVVMSVGNWYVHKRHLQTQVDAAVFAAGQDFVGCFLNPVATNTLVKNSALQYAGDTQRGSATNLQVQQPEDVRVVLNSADYWSTAQAGLDPATGYTLDWTMDGDPATPGPQSSQPCDARFIDAKATDDRLPLIWRWLPLFPSAKSHATVEIHELPGLSGFLPWAVPEAAPRTVAALFVDQDAAENQGVPSDVVMLTGPPDPSATTPKNGENVALWSGNGSASIVDSTGVVILTSRQLLTATDLQGKRLDEICTLNATACYGSVPGGGQNPAISTNKTGVGFIHGKPQTDGTGNATATVTDVELSTLTSVNGLPNGGSPCTDDTAPYYVWTQADCDVRIRAQVDFGSAILSGGAREVRVSTSPFGNKCNGGISLQKTVQGGLLWWEQEAGWTTLPAGSGQTNFYLCWNGESAKPGGGTNPEGGVFGNRVQQMAFAANTDATSNRVFSGPLVSLAVLPTSSPKAAQGVSVAVGLLPPLSISDGNAKPIFLRIAGTGSLNQALQCDKQLQLEDMVRDGCKTPYQVNTRNLVCDPYTISNLPPPLPPPDPDPWPDCIQAKTGDVTAMAKGLHQRFEAPPAPKVPCPPNNWKQYRAAGVVPPDTDPRFVTLVVAEYGTFNAQGNKILPITKFAGFYATGWFTTNSSGGTQGCPDNDPPPPCPDPANPSGSICDPGATRYQGAVWGYFVKQVFPSPQRPGTTLCVFSQVGVCSADLVK
jgi:hypothetical protein